MARNQNSTSPVSYPVAPAWSTPFAPRDLNRRARAPCAPLQTLMPTLRFSSTITEWSNLSPAPLYPAYKLSIWVHQSQPPSPTLEHFTLVLPAEIRDQLSSSTLNPSTRKLPQLRPSRFPSGPMLFFYTLSPLRQLRPRENLPMPKNHSLDLEAGQDDGLHWELGPRGSPPPPPTAANHTAAFLV